MKSLADVLGTKPMGAAAAGHEPEAPSLDRVQDFCRAIIESPEYRQSILDRITLGDLPPAIEAMLWDRACGKVVDRLEIDDHRESITTMSKQELLERIALMQELVQELPDDDTSLTLH